MNMKTRIQKIPLFKAVSLLLLLVCFMTSNAFGQTTIYTEDFESVGPILEFTDGTSSINGLSGWSYDQENMGILDFDYTSRTGNYSAAMAAQVGGTEYTRNYLTLTIDLSEYDVKHDDIHLTFYAEDLADEAHAADRVWIRSSVGSANLQAVNVTGAGAWTFYDVNLSDILRAAGENFTSTTQIVFGQEDNFGLGTDGRAYDDIEIYGWLGTHSNYVTSTIVTPSTSSCGRATDSVTVAITNNTGVGVNDVPVSVEVTLANGSTQTLTGTYNDVIADGATVLLNVGNINTTTPGEYMIKAITQLAGVQNAFGYGYLSTQDFTIEPYYFTNFDGGSMYDGFWKLHNASLTPDFIVSNQITPTQNAIVVSPKVKLNDTNSVVAFNIRFTDDAALNQLDAEDSVLVQISNNCGTSYTTIDTIFSADYAGGFQSYSYNINQLVFAGDEVNIRILGGKAGTTTTAYYTFEVDWVEFSDNVDIMITSIYNLPESNFCNGFATDTILIDIQNMLPNALEDVEVEAQIRMIETGELVQTLTRTIALNEDFGGGIFGATRAHVGVVNTLTPGTYGIYVSTLMPDANMGNNEAALIQTVGTATSIDLPAIATNFGDIGGWSTSGLISQGDSAYFNLAAPGSTGSITSPMVNATAATTLELALRATSDTLGGGTQTNFMGSGDTVTVEVSADCGVNWTVISTIDSVAYGSHKSFQTYSIDLSGYAGQSIIARVVAKHEEPANSIVTTFRPRIDLVKVLEGNDIDVSMVEVYASEKECGEPTDTVYVVLRNSGVDDVSNITFSVDISLNGNTTTIEGTYAGTLSYEELDTAYVIINSELLGNYSFAARTTMADDNYTPNDGDVFNGKTYTTAVTVPRYYLFEGGTPSGWTEDGFTVGGGVYQTTVFDGDVNTLTTSRLAGVASNHYLFFDYFVANNMGTDELSLEESLSVYISDDCDNGYTLVETIDQSSHLPTGAPGEFRRVYIPLTAFDGDQIWVRLEADKVGTTTYNDVTFVIDMLGISPYIDAHLLDLDLSTLSCGSDNDSVTVTVQNSGLEDLTDIPVKLIMHFDNWDYEFDQTVTLAAGATAELVFNGLNTSYPGNYDFTALVNVENDIVPGNDMMEDNASMLDTEPIPYLKTDDWFNGDWTLNNFLSWNFETAYSTLYPGDVATATSMSIGEIGADSKLSVEYFIRAYGDFGNQSVLGVGDTIKTQVSTDCGVSWNTLSTLHASNLKDFDGEWSDGFSGLLMYDTMSIGSYAGENIMVRIEVSKSDVPASSTDYFEYLLGYVSINNGNDVNINFIDLEDAYCASANDTVWVQVQNNSIYAAIDVPVLLTVETPNGGMYMLYDTIPNIDAQNGVDSAIFVLNTVDSVGTFNLTAETMLEGDDSPGFATTTRTIVDTYFSPYLDNFTTTPSTWDPNDFNTNDYGIYAEVYPGDELTTISPKIVPVTDITQFEMVYQVIGFDNASARVTNALEPGDTIKVSVSTDCGDTWTVVSTISDADHNPAEEYQVYGVDLSTYVNTEVLIAVSIVNNQYNLDAAAYYRMEVDQFKISNGIDVGATEIIRPSTLANCGLAAEPVSVEVTNFASIAQSNIPVTLEVYKSDEDMLMATLTATLAGPLGPNESAIVDMGVVNTSAEGTYEYHAFTTQPGDTVFGSFANDHTDDVHLVQDFINNPFTHNFNTNPTSLGYVLEEMTWSGSDVYSPNLVSGDTSTLVIPKFGAIEEDQFLSFSLYAESNGMNFELSEEDSILVQISSDCGATYATALVIDSSNYKYDGGYQLFYVDLSAYVGMDINARIIGFKYPSMVVDNDYYSYYIDNVSWGVVDPSIWDVQISGVHDAACGTEEVPVYVTIGNSGNLPIDNFDVNVEFTFTNYEDYLLNFVIDTVTLMGGESFTFIADTLNTTMEGDYHVDAYLNVVVDNDMGNNDGSDEVYTAMQQDVPYSWCPYNNYNNVQYLDTIEIIIPDKVGTIAANHMAGLYYYYVADDNSGSQIGNYMRTGDKIEILISTDCGDTYDVLYTIDMNNHHNTNNYLMLGESLAAYEGMTIWSKVRFIKGGVGEADFRFGCFIINYTDNAAANEITWLSNPIYKGCGSDNDSVAVEVINWGINELTSVPVEVVMHFSADDDVYEALDTISGTYTGSIFYNQLDTVIISGFNTTTPGYYSFEAYTVLAGDSVDNGSVWDNGMIAIPYEIPFLEHFVDENNLEDWSLVEDDDLYGSVDINETYPGYAEFTNFRYGDTVMLATPSVGTIDAATMLEINYMAVAWDLSETDPTGNYLRPGDAVNIYVSNDCFATETLIHSINSTNHVDTNDFQSLILPLTDFAGSDIVVKIEVIKGQIGEMELFVDYISISNPDVGILDMFSWTTPSEEEGDLDLCGPAVDSVYARIMNYGMYDVTDVPVEFIVDGSATSLTYVGTIEAGNLDTLFLGTVPTVVDDVIEVIVYTNLATDINTSNDSLQARITRQPVQVPYRAFSEDWVYDQWIFDDMWRSGSYNIQSGNIDGVDDIGTVDSAWAVTPVITGISEMTYLVFDYDIDITMITHFIFNEQIIIEVSTDCGATFTAVDATYVNNIATDVDITDINNEASEGTVYADLSAFAGQDIIIKINAITGRSESDFDIRLEDIKVIDLPVHRPEIHQPISDVVCNDATYEFSTLGLPQAELYNWVIVPAEAGSVKGNGAIAEITFNEEYYGELELTVQGVLDDQAIPNIEYEDDGQREMWGDFLNDYAGIIAYKFINGYKYYMDGTVRSEYSVPLILVADACLNVGTDETGMDSFTVYPNPSADFVNIDIPGNEGLAEISVFSVSGELMVFETTEDKMLDLDLSDLAEGVYLIEIEMNNTVSQSKLIIEK